MAQACGFSLSTGNAKPFRLRAAGSRPYREILKLMTLPPEGKLFIPLIPIIILPFVWVYKEKSSGGVLFAVDFFLQRVEIQRET